jgi:hypothetical protein
MLRISTGLGFCLGFPVRRLEAGNKRFIIDNQESPVVEKNPGPET